MDRLDRHEARWFALRTANRHEKKAAKLLEREGVEYYLPLQTVLRKHRGQSPRKRELCLLPCYIFVFINKSEEAKVYQNPYARFLRIGTTRLDIPQSDIDLMKQITGENGLEWTPCDDEGFRENDPVELIGGSFTGLQGYYVKKKNKKHFVIAIQSLNLFGDGYLVAEVDSRYVIRPLKK